MEIECVGVVGAGVIGTSLAQSLLETGHSVVLVDVSQERLREARRTMYTSLRAAKLMGRLKGPEGIETFLDRLHPTIHLERLAAIDYVIENVPERWETKRSLYAEFDRVCDSRCIVAANTSAFPITRIAAATRRPSLIIGVHFMNPVPLKSTVEIIAGRETSDVARQRTFTLLRQMGKQGVLVKDVSGFVSNRVLMLAINEAAIIIRDQIASAGDVDRIFTECLGHAMGPLATADLIGLDTILDTLHVMFEEFGDSKYQACTLLREMVAAGKCGRKSGAGFYSYN